MAKQSQVQHHNEEVERAMGYVASVKSGKTIRLAGIISVDEQMNVVGPGDMAAQINHIYDTMEKTLAKNQADMSNVVNEMIFATDLALLMEPDAMAARGTRYADCAPPAATAVQVAGLASPDALIEIQATAELD